ncbi:RNA polymerase sigma factor [Pedobacter heparinus]|uniref:RNA polymerase sigma-70 factor n=1 Tax=Pedobacter heparinus (strain ATCC 13125 / DSM 2366 / CIP 104194 / JCM 7457 / NBRC 12017 / NCIMB 9290 / NRRL B-14731 / HIM 762-3) TaxID=485917 RepID=C6XT34_PEDHD|nr:RNA polymerase sigma-70 factor [Pedobacter heparinus]ACU03595.1 RNA polymerase sigma-70 factor [Pedobacter heparinus DSM 2366]
MKLHKPDLTLVDEKELVALLQKGDKGAFGELYHRYKRKLYYNFRKLLKSESQAEELLQQLFVKIWENRLSLDPDKVFKAYLFRIAENLVYDFFRKASRDKNMGAILMTVATENYSHIEEAIYSKEREALINRAVASLPPQRRHVFTLCKLEGKTYEEVSVELGISTSTINDHIVKATRSVREYLFVSKEFALLFLLAFFIK